MEGECGCGAACSYSTTVSRAIGEPHPSRDVGQSPNPNVPADQGMGREAVRQPGRVQAHKRLKSERGPWIQAIERRDSSMDESLPRIPGAPIQTSVNKVSVAAIVQAVKVVAATPMRADQPGREVGAKLAQRLPDRFACRA